MLKANNIKTSKNNRQTGTKYEELAANFLENKGHKILAKNYRNKFGEIDIISQIDNQIVISEVKYRSASYCGDPLEAITNKKIRTICKTTLYFYMSKGISMDYPCRFDVIAIHGDNSVQHIENAFEFIY